MNRKWIYRAALILAMSVIIIVGIRILAWRTKKNTVADPEFVLFYAENQTVDYPTTLGAQRFSDLVYERTDGRIKILVRCDAELGSESEVIRQMMYGGIAFARVSLSQLAEYMPEMNVLQMPYLYSGSDHMWRVLDGEIGDEFLLKTLDHDLVGLSWYDAGARNFYSTTPIRTLSDLEGMTIRVQESDVMADMVSALKAKPVKIVYSDVYSAIERGIVDGAENNWPSYESMNHYSVARYYTVDEHTRVPELQICSKAVWDMLSPEDQAILSQCARESAIYQRELWQDREKTSRKIAESAGVTVIELTQEEKIRFRDAMRSVYTKYCGDQMDILNTIMEY